MRLPILLFWPFLQRETTFATICLLPLFQRPSKLGSALKQLAPRDQELLSSLRREAKVIMVELLPPKMCPFTIMFSCI